MGKVKHMSKTTETQNYPKGKLTNKTKHFAETPPLILGGLLAGATLIERRMFDEMFNVIGRIDDNSSTFIEPFDESNEQSEHEKALQTYQLKYVLAESLAHHGQSEIDSILAKFEKQSEDTSFPL